MIQASVGGGLTRKSGGAKPMPTQKWCSVTVNSVPQTPHVIG